MPEGVFRILNWNIGGAKYLESKPGRLTDPKSRDGYHKKLNDYLRAHLSGPESPHVVTIQEVVEYERYGDTDNVRRIIDDDCISSYDYLYSPLIDTERHSHQGKWHKTRANGVWHCSAPDWNCTKKPCGEDPGECRKVYFAQGNATLIRRDCPSYPIWELPTIDEISLRHDEMGGHAMGVPAGDTEERTQRVRRVEEAQLECGLYFGDRNTEPRAAQVTHVALHELSGERLPKPLDILIVNLHLTTLMKEREGVPGIDERAAQTRMRQLDIVLNDVVSRYNSWRKSHYYVREIGEKMKEQDRYAPVWVLAGDFNFTPESLEYQSLVRRGFIDLMSREVGPGGTVRHRLTKAKGPGEDPTITLDYVFAGPRFEALAPRHVDNCITHNSVDLAGRASDHYPLMVEIPIKLD